MKIASRLIGVCITLAILFIQVPATTLDDGGDDDSPLRSHKLNYEIDSAIKQNFMYSISSVDEFSIKYGGFLPTSWSQGSLGIPNFTLINQVMIPELIGIVAQSFTSNACYTECGYDVNLPPPLPPLIGLNFTVCGGPTVIGAGLIELSLISDKLYAQKHTVGQILVSQTGSDTYLACADLLTEGVIANQQCRYDPLCYPKSLADTRTYKITGTRCHEVLRSHTDSSVSFLISKQIGLGRMQIYGPPPSNFSSATFLQDYGSYPWG